MGRIISFGNCLDARLRGWIELAEEKQSLMRMLFVIDE